MARAAGGGGRGRLRAGGRGAAQEPVHRDLRRAADPEAPRREGLRDPRAQGGPHGRGPGALSPRAHAAGRGGSPRARGGRDGAGLAARDPPCRRDRLSDVAAARMPRRVRRDAARDARRDLRDRARRHRRAALRGPCGHRHRLGARRRRGRAAPAGAVHRGRASRSPAASARPPAHRARPEAPSPHLHPRHQHATQERHRRRRAALDREPQGDLDTSRVDGPRVCVAARGKHRARAGRGLPQAAAPQGGRRAHCRAVPRFLRPGVSGTRRRAPRRHHPRALRRGMPHAQAARCGTAHAQAARCGTTLWNSWLPDLSRHSTSP
jgi:hypothetical protein